MPLVISYHSRSVHYIDSEDVLAEVLGHSNFDGEDWAVGDKLVFEDGTQSTIELSSDGLFYVWPDPHPADLNTICGEVGEFLPDDQLARLTIGDWRELFLAVDGALSRAPASAGGSRRHIVVAVLLVVGLLACLGVVGWLTQ